VFVGLLGVGGLFVRLSCVDGLFVLGRPAMFRLSVVRLPCSYGQREREGGGGGREFLLIMRFRLPRC